MRQFQVYSSVRVIDTELENHGQVGLVIGDGEEKGTIKVQFETEAGKVDFDFQPESLQGL